MKTKIMRAIAAALVIGGLLLAGTAPYGPPGVRGSALTLSGK
ncbi:MAG TPA: hypothetical protein PLO33_13150 [Kouleothrix sp.]|nr:hypothetical protein [Kouleothrix sp.]HRC76615.1 hypothetical protein [Kouleothrix sp.]